MQGDCPTFYLIKALSCQTFSDTNPPIIRFKLVYGVDNALTVSK